MAAVSERSGRPTPEITYRVYSYLMADEAEVGRAAMTATMGALVPDGYPLCTAEAGQSDAAQ